MGLHSMQHHPHHQSQGPAPSHVPQHPRPSSVVHPQHHPPPQPQHPNAYSPAHPIPSAYQQQSQPSTAQHPQDLPYYAQASPYSTPGVGSGYASAETTEMMAATMPRPTYPPMQYHTPQSNSPASVASPSGHDQQRSIYGQPAPLHQQSMYYGAPPQQTQYPSLPAHPTQSPYAQHTQQPHQPMTSQPNMMMSHAAPQHQMSQHPAHHPQAGMTGSPRHGKMESHGMPQMQRSAAPPAPLGTPQQNQNGGALSTPGGSSAGVNPNAAPGPIPATTPLVVRQDGNGVQWIAFEYSRDRVKMEYTIRCDVESVNTDELSTEFRTENCVYPRACCPKDQYRGNRLQYETECNTVGWALAELNPPLRGKRGLIQRAVDSWRNSNQDPRLRSRRVRRMAKMSNRKAVTSTHPAAHMSPGPHGGMSTPGPMSHGGASMGKPGMGSLGPPMHHHHADGHAQGGDEVGDGDSAYMADQHTHHHQTPVHPVAAPGQAPGSGVNPGEDARQAHVFNGYNNGYPAPGPSSGHGPMPSIHDTLSGSPHPGQHGLSHPHPHQSHASGPASAHGPRAGTEPADLFPDIPEAKKRKFILVEDSDRHSRLRVRVTLDGVDTNEIPDSFRKGASVFPRSYFPREMQSPPPSATGSRFFEDDDAGIQDDGGVETEGPRKAGAGSNRDASTRAMVRVPVSGDGAETELAIPRMRRNMRGKEVRLNDLGYRMAWLQSRVFAGRTVFLQRALDCYRNKTRAAVESVMQDVRTAAPHYETRVGKRRWNERASRAEKRNDDE